MSPAGMGFNFPGRFWATFLVTPSRVSNIRADHAPWLVLSLFSSFRGLARSLVPQRDDLCTLLPIPCATRYPMLGRLDAEFMVLHLDVLDHSYQVILSRISPFFKSTVALFGGRQGLALPVDACREPAQDHDSLLSSRQ
jgi:hypothetical protein